MADKTKNEVLLRVENLCQYFGRTKAVDDVSFQVHKGEVFGLVGESGCGKTTTGRSIIRLYNITSGSIYFKGVRIAAGTKSYRDEIKAKRAEIKALRASGAADAQEKIARCNERIDELKKQIASAKYDHENVNRDYAKKLVQQVKDKYAKQIAAGDKEAKRQCAKEIRIAKKTRLTTQIQMIFQDPIASLDGRMTVKETIAEGLVINGMKDQAEIDEKVYQILETVGLVREHASRYPHEFSGGQRQRIGIARAIIMNPELLIADEPISALDVSIQAQVINLLNDLRENLDLTVLFIAHDLSVVKYFSDRIGVMYFGHLVELASSDGLFDHPMHPYTRSLLSAIPLPDPHSEKNRKRISYNALAEHDYSVDKPTLREIYPGHFVRCNDAEERKFKEELGL